MGRTGAGGYDAGLSPSSATSGPSPSSYGGGYAALMGRPAPDDEVIPTAIVIKNIPFHVPKETLLGVMEDLNLPPPFAFNYHFDQGQFRGLAFANFRDPAHAGLCVTALNGFDLQGRKLRTEFKKVLKEGEKERIERDKALKRMRSQQQLTVEPPMGPPIGTWNRREASAPGGYVAGGGYGGEDEDFGRVVQGQFSTNFNHNNAGPRHATRDYVAPPHLPVSDNSYGVYTQPISQYGTSPPSDVGTSVSQRMTSSGSGSGSEGYGSGSGSGGHSRASTELDLNDPHALEIYSRVLLFRDDSLRDELAFARSLTAPQRRVVHLVAKKLGLDHRSVGEGEERCVVVYKAGVMPTALATPEPPRSKPLRHTFSTLGRKASRDLLSSLASPDNTYSSPTNPSGYGYNSPSNPHTNTSSRLGFKKSMPDIRSSPHNSYQQQSAPSPTARRSNANLRDGYSTMGSAGARLSRNGLSGGSGHPSVIGLFQQFDQPPLPMPTSSAPRMTNSASSTQLYYQSQSQSLAPGSVPPSALPHSQSLVSLHAHSSGGSTNIHPTTSIASSSPTTTSSSSPTDAVHPPSALSALNASANDEVSTAAAVRQPKGPGGENGFVGAGVRRSIVLGGGEGFGGVETFETSKSFEI